MNKLKLEYYRKNSFCFFLFFLHLFNSRGCKVSKFFSKAAENICPEVCLYCRVYIYIKSARLLITKIALLSLAHADILATAIVTRAPTNFNDSIYKFNGNSPVV